VLCFEMIEEVGQRREGEGNGELGWEHSVLECLQEEKDLKLVSVSLVTDRFIEIYKTHCIIQVPF